MLEALFNPASIAVVGASATPGKVGHTIVNNLLRFKFTGRVIPVNPRGGEILGLPVARSIREVNPRPDMVIVSVPAPVAVQTIRECEEMGVGVCVVISAGFKEVGGDGARLEEELKEIVRRGKTRVLGPNCLGVINTANSMNATFANLMLPKGRIAFFSQSGALGVAVLDWAISNNIGFSKFVSLGNKADLNETDFIEYLMNDPETDVILGYIEDVVQGKRFLRVARRCTKKKPIILIKSGGTQAGARAASSHTGALAGSDTAFNAAFKQTGVIRADGVKELFELARLFVYGRLPRGNRILVITNAGGPGIITADHAERAGLELPYLNKTAINRLRKRLPSNASLYNPIDVIGDAGPDRYEAVLEVARAARNIDGIVVILTPQAMTDPEGVAERVISATEKTRIPIVTTFMGGISVESAVQKLRARGIPNYSYPEDAIRAYRSLVGFSMWRKRKAGPQKRFTVDSKRVKQIFKDSVASGRYELGEDEARECLRAYGFNFPRQALAKSPDEAVRLSAEIGFPVVMKVSSPDILHKTDVGGVKVGISSKKEARDAFSEITTSSLRHHPDALIRGVNIYEMVSGGKEVIAGVTYDRTFGHMLMFGLGGIYVEVLKDVSFRVVPVTETDVREMVSEIRSYALLKGTRGERPVDIDGIVETLLRINQMVQDFPEIYELDINPLVVKPEGVWALDARIILQGGK